MGPVVLWYITFNRRLNHLRGVHSHITVGKNSKSHTSIPLWCTKGMLTRFDGAQKSLPSATWRDDYHGTCETLRSAERQGPTDSEPVELANSTTPLILYRLQKESNRVFSQPIQNRIGSTRSLNGWCWWSCQARCSANDHWPCKRGAEGPTLNWEG